METSKPVNQLEKVLLKNELEERTQEKTLKESEEADLNKKQEKFNFSAID